MEPAPVVSSAGAAPNGKGKVVFCTPTIKKPFTQYLDAMEASIPLITEAGWEEGSVYEVGNPYISQTRANMLRKALDAKADVIVFIDHDLSWSPDALLKLIETDGHVVSGAYRFKEDEERYMGRLFQDEQGRPIVREDGCVRAEWIPAGFMKITKEAVDWMMGAYPALCYGPRYAPLYDLFNHGAHKGVWWGEDYAFSRRWNEADGEIWVIPDLDLTHHSADQAYPGNYHRFLLRQKPRELKEAA